MKRLFLQIIFSVLCLSAQAQKVSNIRAEQHGQDIVVLYSLDSNSPCEVSLLLSQDNGATWSAPLKNVSGHVGKNISGGEKQITWKVLEGQEDLVGDKMKFKVIANGKKSFEPEMVFVEGGTFLMGSDYGEEREKPIHKVTLSSFSIGKFEVTQSQWAAVMNENPSYFHGCIACPVEVVTWFDVQNYIEKLNLLTGKNYRLPTEAEWEYAAKGGVKGNNFKYSGSNDIITIAWYEGNSGNKTHPVGYKKSNELGVCDMSGNVWEWCSDWRGSYSVNYEINPIGPVTGECKVLRGGQITSYEEYCTNTYRICSEPDTHDFRIGFRLVLPVGN